VWWWSVDYRLAPEHPFLAGLAVGGESAGGGLAAAVALLARDRGGPALCLQYLAVPELDDRLETPSMRAFTDTPVWNPPIAELSWSHYLGGAGRRGGRDVSRTRPRPGQETSPGCRRRW